MNSDGTGKTALPASVTGTPSRLLHGGRRWFMHGQDLGVPGNPHWELFVVRDDGNGSVQLTNDPTLEIGWSGTLATWMPGETATAASISFFGQRWVFDGVEWSIDPDSVGIYTADVLFDGDGNATGLAAAPSLLVPLTGFNSYDWSPDLLEIVSSSGDFRELRVTDILSGETRVIATGWFSGPAWSPAGNVIAFHDGYGTIATIQPDGTGQTAILRGGGNYANSTPICWSPSGSQLVHRRDPGWDLYQSDVYRANANGSGKTNLTGDLPNSARPIAWR
jgi:hypothetical protein